MRPGYCLALIWANTMDAATIPRDLTEVPVFAKSLLAGVVIAAL